MLSEENAQLKQSSEQLSSDLTMLQDTIGAIGDKGDDWIGQLRFLYQAQKRENDRHSYSCAAMRASSCCSSSSTLTPTTRFASTRRS